MRLIDADVLKAKQQEDADLFIGDNTLSGKSRRDEALNAVANIVNAPTVDIDVITESCERTGYDRGFRDGYEQATSEVVRCFQCKYAKVADYEDDQDGYVCQFHKGSIWFSGDFCSQGRRRENAEIH